MIPSAALGGLGRVAFPGGLDPNFASVTALLHFDGSPGSTTMTDVIGNTFTAVGTDADLASTTLLLNFQGANASTTITDEAPSPHTLTVNGNAQLSTAQQVYGLSALALDGTGDYLSHAASADFRYAADFTLEFWVRQTSAATAVMFDNRSSSASATGFAIYCTSTSLSFFTNNSDRIVQGAGLTPATWTHIALVRSGTTMKMYVNGTALGTSYTSAANFSDGTIFFGADTAGTNALNGYMSHFRITKGVARYTANFTVAPYGWTTDAVLEGSAVKFGTAALFCDGVHGTYVTSGAVARAGYQLPGDFTLECWVYWLVSGGTDFVIDGRALGNSTTGFVIYRSAGLLTALAGSSSVQAAAPASINAWHHIALVRSGGSTLALYMDGTSVGGTGGAGTNLTDGMLQIGATPNNSGVLVQSEHAYIDDVRLTKGVARYVANFSAPTVPFPDS